MTGLSTFTQTSSILVDSSRRRQKSINTCSDMFSLGLHPLFFKSGSSRVRIRTGDTKINHKFKIGDQILLINVVSKSLMLTGAISIKRGSSFAHINHPAHGMSLYGTFDPRDSKQFIAVNYVEKLPQAYVPDDEIPDTKTFYILRKNHKFFPMVQIKGLGTNNSPESAITQHGLQLSTLNGYQTVYLLFRRIDGIFQHDPNSWLLDLGTVSSVNYTDVNLEDTQSMYLIYNHLFNIPLSILNHRSELPATITNVENDFVEIDVQQPAVVDPIYPFYDFKDSGIELNQGGGHNVYLRIITDTIEAYPSPNFYVYPLDRIYRNVSQVRLIGTAFPNSQRLINNSNNNLRWKNLSDGDHVYELEIQCGNYDPRSLSRAIQSASNLIPRIRGGYHDLHVEIDTQTDVVTIRAYQQVILTDRFDQPVLTAIDAFINLIFDQSFRPACQIFSFFTETLGPHTRNCLYNFKEQLDDRTIHFYYDSSTRILVHFASQNIKLSINCTTNLNTYEYDSQIRQLYLPNHRLDLGSLIISDIFDTELVMQVISVIDNSNLILAPSQSCLIFNGKYWGLDDVPSFSVEIPPHLRRIIRIWHPNHQLRPGTSIQISQSQAVNTVPSHIINNLHIISTIIDSNYYEIELQNYAAVDVLDQTNCIIIQYPDVIQLLFNYPNTIGSYLGFAHAGESHAITNFSHSHQNTNPYILESMDPNFSRPHPKLNFTGPSYFFICCPQLPSIHQTSPVTNAFALIRWTDNPPSMVFDSFVPVTHHLQNNLDQLSELTFSMVNPDGTLVDFNQIDHHFVLEITEQIQIPDGTEQEGHFPSRN